MKRFAILAFFMSGCVSLRDVENRTDQEILSQVAVSAVGIDMAQATGSGTVIYTDRLRSLVLTCEHVVEHDSGEEIQVVVTRSNGDEDNYPAIRIKVEKYYDLALVMAMGDLRVPAMPIATREPKLFEKLYSVASPMGVNQTASTQVLTNLHYNIGSLRHNASVYQLTGFTIGGSSGGTVANYLGELVAVIEAGRMYGPFPITAMGFAIPLPDIRTFLREYKL